MSKFVYIIDSNFRTPTSDETRRYKVSTLGSWNSPLKNAITSWGKFEVRMEFGSKTEDRRTIKFPEFGPSPYPDI
jgi:hypothetical protein